MKRRRKQPPAAVAAKMKRQKQQTLSDLPDLVLIHILSFLKPKEAVQTCILSSRWEHLWKHLTALKLNSSDFRTVKSFMEFVNGFLSLRNYSKPLNALDFEYQGRVVSHELERTVSHGLERIVRYAASHDINCLRLSYDNGRFPHSLLLSCQSLTSLDIGSQSYDRQKGFSNSLNLPALTYLKLRHFSFYNGKDGRVEPFSTFNRLDTLILYGCTFPYAEQSPFCISSTTLLNLSIHSGYKFSQYLRSEGGFSNIELSAPSLCTFALACNPFPKISGSHLSSIKQVGIDVQEAKPPLDILNFLIELTNMESLTITPRTIEVLSSVHDIKLKLTSLCNLKSLKMNLKLCTFSATELRDIKLELAGGKSWKENAKLRETIKARTRIYSSNLDGVIEFLLQNSPAAKIDILLEG